MDLKILIIIIIIIYLFSNSCYCKNIKFEIIDNDNHKNFNNKDLINTNQIYNNYDNYNNSTLERMSLKDPSKKFDKLFNTISINNKNFYDILEEVGNNAFLIIGAQWCVPSKNLIININDNIEDYPKEFRNILFYNIDNKDNFLKDYVKKDILAVPQLIIIKDKKIVKHFDDYTELDKFNFDDL